MTYNSKGRPCIDVFHTSSSRCATKHSFTLPSGELTSRSRDIYPKDKYMVKEIACKPIYANIIHPHAIRAIWLSYIGYGESAF